MALSIEMGMGLAPALPVSVGRLVSVLVVRLVLAVLAVALVLVVVVVAVIVAAVVWVVRERMVVSGVTVGGTGASGLGMEGEVLAVAGTGLELSPRTTSRRHGRGGRDGPQELRGLPLTRVRVRGRKRRCLARGPRVTHLGL